MEKKAVRWLYPKQVYYFFLQVNTRFEMKHLATQNYKIFYRSSQPTTITSLNTKDLSLYKSCGEALTLIHSFLRYVNFEFNYNQVKSLFRLLGFSIFVIFLADTLDFHSILPWLLILHFISLTPLENLTFFLMYLTFPLKNPMMSSIEGNIVFLLKKTYLLLYSNI